jgi:hypothetical protein
MIRLWFTICTAFLVLTVVGQVDADTDGASPHAGPFVRFSLGPGSVVETASIQLKARTIPAKHHAAGWFIVENTAVHVSEFGGMIAYAVGEYSHVNIDGLGMGLTRYLMPWNTYLTIAGGYGVLSFSPNWWDVLNFYDKQLGLAATIGFGKEWRVGRMWGLGLGGQGMYFHMLTAGHRFWHFGFMASVTFG